MILNYEIVTKNSLHITFDLIGAEMFISNLRQLLQSQSLEILFDAPMNYRGKKLMGLIFSVVNRGEYVSLSNGCLNLEIEEEMVQEFIEFIANAILHDGFETPEIISFSPKTRKDTNLTIYGFILNNNTTN